MMGCAIDDIFFDEDEGVAENVALIIPWLELESLCF
jgi:hypothetical protein